jgi:hypothetical protein
MKCEPISLRAHNNIVCDTSNIYDLIHTLKLAMGWNLHKSMQMWTDACEKCPDCYNLSLDDDNQIAYVYDVQLSSMIDAYQAPE